MKKRDPLLGAPPVIPPNTPSSAAAPRRRRRWGKGAWLTYGHLIILIAALIGWEHLDVLWPTFVWPEGIRMGPQRRLTGLLTIGDAGRPTRLNTSAGLIADWQYWVKQDERQDSSQCLVVPEPTRQKLAAGMRARPGMAGILQYWVDIIASDRLGPARCGQSGGLQIMEGLDALKSIRPVQCSREAFVAHGFVCPGERRSARLESETFEDMSNYYPDAALRSGSEGRVLVRVERDETGSPIACRILQSSNNGDLDRQTCKLVGTDPGFTAAPPDTSRADLSRPITQAVRWQLPTDKPVRH